MRAEHDEAKDSMMGKTTKGRHSMLRKSLKGRLNVFQCSMLRWRDLHPYSAVHVIRIEQPLDPLRLQAVIDTQIAQWGLTGLVLDSVRGRYEYTGDPLTTPVGVMSASGDSLGVVCAEIERQLNLPFAREGRIDPFRFFAVDAGGAFHLGVAYDHFVAGGDSIVILLKGLFDCYVSAASVTSAPRTAEATTTSAAATRAPELYPPRFRRLLLRNPWQLLRGARRFWEMPASCRRGFRPRYTGASDQRNGFACLRVETADAERFARTATAWGVTQNDLLIAILMRVLSAFTEERHLANRRNELAIASVINLRRDFGYRPTDAFGQFLSSFRVSHRVPADITLRQLAWDVHAESTRLRQNRRYFQTLLAMQLTGAIWRFVAPEKRAGFHAKNYPVWAGTTPLNVNSLWQEAGGAVPAPEYVRGVSTGPIAPLIVAMTSAGTVFHAGLSYRTAAFSRDNIDTLRAGIQQSIHSLPDETTTS